MKKIIGYFGILLLMTRIGYAQPSVIDNPLNPNAPEMKFETEEIDYGTIEYDADGTREFKFKNTGKEPLIISEIEKACGCTTPHFSKDPVKPGETSIIKVHYDTKRAGTFNKTITVISNAKTSRKQLHIKGVINPQPK